MIHYTTRRTASITQPVQLLAAADPELAPAAALAPAPAPAAAALPAPAAPPAPSAGVCSPGTSIGSHSSAVPVNKQQCATAVSAHGTPIDRHEEGARLRTLDSEDEEEHVVVVEPDFRHGFGLIQRLLRLVNQLHFGSFFLLLFLFLQLEQSRSGSNKPPQATRQSPRLCLPTCRPFCCPSCCLSCPRAPPSSWAQPWQQAAPFASPGNEQNNRMKRPHHVSARPAPLQSRPFAPLSSTHRSGCRLGTCPGFWPGSLSNPRGKGLGCSAGRWSAFSASTANT